MRYRSPFRRWMPKDLRRSAKEARRRAPPRALTEKPIPEMTPAQIHRELHRLFPARHP